MNTERFRGYKYAVTASGTDMWIPVRAKTLRAAKMAVWREFSGGYGIIYFVAEIVGADSPETLRFETVAVHRNGQWEVV